MVLHRDDWAKNKPNRKWRIDIHTPRYKMAEKRASGRVLDLGCGMGYGSYLMSLGNNVNSVVGLDVDSASIKYASENYGRENILFCTGTATNLQYENSFFDAITCFEVLEHVDDQAALLGEIRRVLKDGGSVFLSTPNNRDLLIRLQVLFGIVEKWPEKYQPNPYHIKEFFHEELLDFVEKKGFIVLRKYGQVLRVPYIWNKRFLFSILNCLAFLVPRLALVTVLELKKKLK